MKKNMGKHNLDGIAALLLFAVFAVCILMVLLTGAGAYRRLTSRDNAAYAQRTGVQYLAQRVRQADRQGGVALDDFEGVPALLLEDGDGYLTRVYVYDGWLMELYTSPETSLSPQSGEYIMEAESLKLALNDGVLGMGLTVEDQTDWLYLDLRCGKGWSQ